MMCVYVFVSVPHFEESFIPWMCVSICTCTHVNSVFRLEKFNDLYPMFLSIPGLQLKSKSCKVTHHGIQTHEGSFINFITQKEEGGGPNNCDSF